MKSVFHTFEHSEIQDQQARESLDYRLSSSATMGDAFIEKAFVIQRTVFTKHGGHVPGTSWARTTN